MTCQEFVIILIRGKGSRADVIFVQKLKLIVHNKD